MRRAFIATSFVLGFIAIGLVVYVKLNTPEGHPNFPQEYVEKRLTCVPPYWCAKEE